MPITRLENPRIYRQIADQLKRLIENNEFPPGSRLPSERDLAQQLQVSRASVREALIALEVIGLVDVKVGNGVIVRSQTPLAPSQEPVMAQAGRNQWAEIDDELNIELDFNAELPPFSLLQTRLLIEPETAALAARHATDEELAGKASAAALIMISRLISINSRLRRMTSPVRPRTNRTEARISPCVKGIMRVPPFFFYRCRSDGCSALPRRALHGRYGRQQPGPRAAAPERTDQTAQYRPLWR